MMGLTELGRGFIYPGLQIGNRREYLIWLAPNLQYQSLDYGIQYLASLVAESPSPVPAIDLYERVARLNPGTLSRSGEPSIDNDAALRYRARLRQLAESREDANRLEEDAKLVEIDQEVDGLKAELHRSLGLGGRPRVKGDPESARLSVFRAIRTLKNNLWAKNGTFRELANHLERAIPIVGSYPRYMPEPEFGLHDGPPPPEAMRISHPAKSDDTRATPGHSHAVDDQLRVAGTEHFTKERFLRRRCRMLSGGSDVFQDFMTRFMAESFDVSSEDIIAKQLLEVAGTSFETTMARAAIEESQGRIGEMGRILSSVRFQGHEEDSRLLYLGIANEKARDLGAALEVIHRVLERSEDPVTLTAARFNASVCREKLDEFESVRFSRFVEDRTLVMIREPVWLKAVTMEIITSIRSGRRLQMDEQVVQEALDEELVSCPSGWVKTFLSWARYSDVALSRLDALRIETVALKAKVNVRAGLLFELWTNSEAPSIRRMAVEAVRSMAQSTRDETVIRFWRQMEDHEIGQT